MNPTKINPEALMDVRMVQKDPQRKGDTPLVLKLVEFLQLLSDNPIVTKNLRGQLRGQYDRVTVLSAILLSVGLTLAMMHNNIAPIVTIMGSWWTYLTLGQGFQSPNQILVGITGIWLMPIPFIGFFGGFRTSNVFLAETQKSTLGFVLATPMSTHELILGKIFGAVLPKSLVFFVLLVWTLILTIACLPIGGVILLWSWFLIVFSSWTVLWMLNLLTFALSSMFPKTSMASFAWVWGLLMWFGIVSIPASITFVFNVLASWGIYGYKTWWMFVFLAWGLAMMGYVVSYLAINRMRKTDIGFEGGKQAN